MTGALCWGEVMLQRLNWLFLGLLITSIGVPAFASTISELPNSANTGQCFARVLMPDIVETYTEQITVREAVITQKRVPAVYRTESVSVMVKQAATEYRTLPAVYETITEQILVEPERTEKFVIPATYETWTETIEIEPARLVWKSGSGLYGRGTVAPAQIQAGSERVEISTGEILCRVLEPAKTRTITRTRMVEPARTESRIIPAKYKTVSRQVVRQPPSIEMIEVPAEYADIQVAVMVEPERMVEDIVPAEYRSIERERVVSSGGLSWAEVLCDTNTKSTKIAEIQKALSDRGYPLAVDGIYGAQTQAAMERFQRANGLAVGYMTVATVQALNVMPYG